jgi:hypothetical protein
MLDLMKRNTVDLLVEQFWKHGYLTVSRKFGTYLPEPAKVGQFDVDIIAKHNKNYAIGITLSQEELNDPQIINRLNFLATRQTRYTNKRVLLFIGVHVSCFKNAKVLVDRLEPEARKNIRLFQINDRPVTGGRKSKEKGKILFS